MDEELIILSVINNMKIEWHSINIKDMTNKQIIENIYIYFRKIYNVKKIEIEHYPNCHLKYDDINKLVSQVSGCLFLKVFFDDL